MNATVAMISFGSMPVASANAPVSTVVVPAACAAACVLRSIPGSATLVSVVVTTWRYRGSDALPA